MRDFLRNNGLSTALGAMFLLSLAGMIWTGQAANNKELMDHATAPLGILAYIESGSFLSSLFENWESEFLQMAVYVVLTAVLFQRGSSESRDPDDPHRADEVVAWRGRYPVMAWFYAHSLGLTLAALFLASFVLHWQFSMRAANEDAVLHGGEIATASSYLLDPQLWFESFQNWQSEFLSTALLVVLSIFLRHQGSPESKPVAAAKEDTGA